MSAEQKQSRSSESPLQSLEAQLQGRIVCDDPGGLLQEDEPISAEPTAVPRRALHRILAILISQMRLLWGITFGCGLAWVLARALVSSTAAMTIVRLLSGTSLIVALIPVWGSMSRSAVRQLLGRPRVVYFVAATVVYKTVLYVVSRKNTDGADLVSMTFFALAVTWGYLTVPLIDALPPGFGGGFRRYCMVAVVLVEGYGLYHCKSQPAFCHELCRDYTWSVIDGSGRHHVMLSSLDVMTV